MEEKLNMPPPANDTGNETVVKLHIKASKNVFAK